MAFSGSELGVYTGSGMAVTLLGKIVFDWLKNNRHSKNGNGVKALGTDLNDLKRRVVFKDICEAKQEVYEVKLGNIEGDLGEIKDDMKILTKHILK